MPLIRVSILTSLLYFLCCQNNSVLPPSFSGILWSQEDSVLAKSWCLNPMETINIHYLIRNELLLVRSEELLLTPWRQSPCPIINY